MKRRKVYSYPFHYQVSEVLFQPADSFYIFLFPICALYRASLFYFQLIDRKNDEIEEMKIEYEAKLKEQEVLCAKLEKRGETVQLQPQDFGTIILLKDFYEFP